MDTMSRRKEVAEKSTSKEKQKHISDGYSPKVRPRASHPDGVDENKRISSNIKTMNGELINSPSREVTVRKKKVITEDEGAVLIAKKAASKSPIPVSVIVGCLIVTVLVMYTLSLYVKVEEYNSDIVKAEAKIEKLREEAETLNTKLESKYDLAEIQKVATEEYGMVSADSLPKKYLNLQKTEDVGETLSDGDDEESGLSKMPSGFAAAIRGLME